MGFSVLSTQLLLHTSSSCTHRRCGPRRTCRPVFNSVRGTPTKDRRQSALVLDKPAWASERGHRVLSDKVLTSRYARKTRPACCTTVICSRGAPAHDRATESMLAPRRTSFWNGTRGDAPCSPERHGAAQPCHHRIVHARPVSYRAATVRHGGGGAPGSPSRIGGGWRRAGTSLPPPAGVATRGTHRRVPTGASLYTWSCSDGRTSAP